MSKSNGSVGDGFGKRRVTLVKRTTIPPGIKLSKVLGVAPSLSRDMVEALLEKRGSTACVDPAWSSFW